MARYEALFQVCDISIKNPVESEVNIVRTLREISSDFASISSVKIASFPSDFQTHFHETITRNGVCYTYNMLHHKDLFKNTMIPYLRFPRTVERSNWTVFGYETNEPITYPERIMGSGKEAEIEITLRMRKKDVDFACRSSGNGFRLTIHSPDELPQTLSYFYRIPFNVETLISVEPRVMSTSRNLQHYKPKQRQCFFAGEKQLKFFKAYTQSNCKLECFTSKILWRIFKKKLIVVNIFMVSFCSGKMRMCKIFPPTHVWNQNL